MAESKKKKKVIVSSSPENVEAKPVYRGAKAESSNTLLYNREFYIWMLGGLVLIAVGMLLMTGGHMPDDNTWDDNIIYSFRRTTLAPIVIVAGLIVEVYAIFKK